MEAELQERPDTSAGADAAPPRRRPLADRLRSVASDHHTLCELWLHGSAAVALGLVAWSLAPADGIGKVLDFDGPSAAAKAVVRINAPEEELSPAQAEALEPEFKLQDLTPQGAEAYNDSIPVSTAPNPPARPFMLISSSPQDELRALNCLTAAVYYEAGNEPLEGLQAVAQVVLNRVRDPAYPNTVCGVVFEGSHLATGWQFSFTGDGSLARKPSAAGWARSKAVARAALNGFVAKRVGQATHYHTRWVAPYWSPRLNKVANIGAHIFYRWLGARGLPGAFTDQYAQSEPFLPQIAALDPDVIEAPPAPVLVAVADASGDEGRPSGGAMTVAELTPPLIAPDLAPVETVLPEITPVVLQAAPIEPEAAQTVTPRKNRRVAFGSTF